MNNKILKHKALIMLLAVIMIAALGSTAFGQQTEQGFVLIVEQSPPDSGIVTPDVGVHRPNLNQTVPIQAIPKMGYKFIYWMGDVANPTSNRTSVILDSPKIVIAVFERETFELLSRSNVSTGGRGGGGAIARPRQASKGDVAEGSIYRDPPEWPPYTPPPISQAPIPVPGEGDTPIDEDNEIPVPGDGDPIPEPATMAMLAAGTMFLRKRNRSRIQK